MNRINAYRQMLPVDFDTEAMRPLGEVADPRLPPAMDIPLPRFYIPSPELGQGSGGAKRANLLRLANQAARGFGK